jgi:hypothetical protein
MRIQVSDTWSVIKNTVHTTFPGRNSRRSRGRVVHWIKIKPDIKVVNLSTYVGESKKPAQSFSRPME